MNTSRALFPIRTSDKLNPEQKGEVTRQMRQALNDTLTRDIQDAWGVGTNTGIADVAEWENAIDGIIETMYPKLYYKTSQWMEKDKIALLGKRSSTPEFVLFHPDHKAEYLKQLSAQRTMVPLAEWEPPKPPKKYCKLLDGSIQVYDVTASKMNDYRGNERHGAKFQHIGKGVFCTENGEPKYNNWSHHFFVEVALTEKDKRKMNYKPRKRRRKG